MDSKKNPLSRAGTANVVGAVSALARFGLAIVWLYSGWMKLSDPLQTKQAIRAYQLFPPELIPHLALAVPAIELILGMFMLLGLFLRQTAIVSAVVFGLFIAGIISAWARGLTIDCGCFGGGGENPDATAMTYLTEIIRDLLFIAMAAWTAWRPLRRFAIHP